MSSSIEPVHFARAIHPKVTTGLEIDSQDDSGEPTVVHVGPVRGASWYQAPCWFEVELSNGQFVKVHFELSAA